MQSALSVGAPCLIAWNLLKRLVDCCLLLVSTVVVARWKADQNTHTNTSISTRMLKVVMWPPVTILWENCHKGNLTLGNLSEDLLVLLWRCLSWTVQPNGSPSLLLCVQCAYNTLYVSGAGCWMLYSKLRNDGICEARCTRLVKLEGCNLERKFIGCKVFWCIECNLMRNVHWTHSMRNVHWMHLMRNVHWMHLMRNVHWTHSMRNVHQTHLWTKKNFSNDRRVKSFIRCNLRPQPLNIS